MNLRVLTLKKRYHHAVGICGYCVRLRDLDNKAPNWDVGIQEKAQIIKKYIYIERESTNNAAVEG